MRRLKSCPATTGNAHGSLYFSHLPPGALLLLLLLLLPLLLLPPLPPLPSHFGSGTLALSLMLTS